ncbi:MAG: hypothetical protein Q8M29_19265 [Bacteroidota bacterium]|nr:hypothetical protein [Bacteroidota bacterium]
MSYTELKLELEKLLSEDLSNRQSLQEMRRNVFLTTESTKKNSELIEAKESEILGLRSTVSQKQHALETRETEIEKVQSLLQAERSGFELSKQNFLSEIEDLKNVIAELKAEQSDLSSFKEEATKLSLENNHFAGKIRELIFHIDEQNNVQEKLEKENTSLRDSLKKSNAEKSQLEFNLADTSSTEASISALNEELETTKNKIILLETQLADAVGSAEAKEDTIVGLNEELESTKSRVVLLQTQLITAFELIDAQNKAAQESENQFQVYQGEISFCLDKLYEEKDLIVKDNADLIAEMAGLTLENEDLYAEQKTLSASVKELQAQVDQFSDSMSELRSKEEIILSLTEEKNRLGSLVEQLSNEVAGVDESAYTSQIELLNEELTTLSAKLEESNSVSKLKIEALEFEKSNLILKLEDLESQLSVKSETPVSESSSSNADDAFIDKLFKQIDLLNDEKLLVQTENEEAHSAVSELQEKCSNLTQVIENQKNDISNLEETNKQIKLAQSLLASGSDKTALKLRINELVREVDKCIALLSVQE